MLYVILHCYIRQFIISQIVVSQKHQEQNYQEQKKQFHIQNKCQSKGGKFVTSSKMEVISCKQLDK